MKIIKAIILLISFVGYHLYAKRKLKLIEEFIPICIFSGINKNCSRYNYFLYKL